MSKLSELSEKVGDAYNRYIAFQTPALLLEWDTAKKAYAQALSRPVKTSTYEDEDLTGKIYPADTYHPVSKPSHYNTDGGVECITYIKQVLGNDGFVAYCRGNVMKYNHRAMYKGNPLEDMAKAQQYLEWANETLKEIHK